MDIIEDIYKNSIQPSERSMNNDKAYTRAKNQINQHYQLLCEKLSKNELITLDKLISCYDTKTERKNIHCFKDGFKKGLAIAVKSLN